MAIAKDDQISRGIDPEVASRVLRQLERVGDVLGDQGAGKEAGSEEGGGRAAKEKFLHLTPQFGIVIPGT
jgi:hypothetical protein